MANQSGGNFGFLAAHDPQLAALAQRAEAYLAPDPNTCLIKLRQFAELLIKHVTAGLNIPWVDDFNANVRRLQAEGVHPDVVRFFDMLRRTGNDAVHRFSGNHQEALARLKVARGLAVWFHRVFGGQKDFKPDPFVPPPDPNQEAAAIADELQQIRQQLADVLVQKQRSDQLIEEEAQRRAQAELLALQRAEEAIIWQSLAEEKEAQLIDREKAASETLVAAARAEAEAAPAAEIQQTRTEAAQQQLTLDEATTRLLIDQQLREAGWEVDSVALTHASGTRPQKGKHTAIAEWPTAKGPADYVLFLGLTPVAVVEAKRKNKDVPAAVVQSQRYSEGYQLAADQTAPGGPWGACRIPFLFATNGRPFLRQLLEQSGIWFHDVRRPQNHPKPLEGWYSPDGLAELLKQNVDEANAALASEPLDYLPIRGYQREAIRAVEDAVEKGQDHILVAMATGTGKTRTCICLLYRLIKAGRFRRILFLVDRTSLGDQAHNSFKDLKVEKLSNFTDIYDVKGLGDLTPDSHTRVHIATIQAMVRRVLFSTPSEPAPPVDQYDCIIVDECHRGYSLDRSLSEVELTFRSEDDYISKFTRVLDHFDAVRIGLTATPAKHTTAIFGAPVFWYTYAQAVIDGFLVDHEPPIHIVTALAEDGINWQVGEEVPVYHARRQHLDYVTLPDEVSVEIDSFNTRVLTENFNRAVCGELARHIDPDLPGKTLIFCATDTHADQVVRLLKEAMDERHGGIHDSAIRKITAAADKPDELIRRYKNEKYPSVAVTVDLLTTGIDVPEIVHLVFLRRVRSRILYEQMVGRATRLCPDIQKERFLIFDAVRLYDAMQEYSDMKPVVVNPAIPFQQLVQELLTVEGEDARLEIMAQLVAKLQRKKRSLNDEGRREFEAMTSYSPDDLIRELRRQTPEEAAEWFRQHGALAHFLDSVSGDGIKFLVSEHADEVRRVERGYGLRNQRPDDYLEGFKAFLEDNLNKIPALLVITQRPRDLTRAQLKELALLLNQHGYKETELQAAWRETTNEEIAASIIGFIRQRALGSTLVPYAERVDRALKRILASRPWTDPQRKWLDIIGKQMKQQTIVDRDALDGGRFADVGGFKKMNTTFDGQLEKVLADLHEAVWEDPAA